MRVLFTGDWQASVMNLSSCHVAADRVLKLCKARSLTTVCFTGDLKAAYNPVDLRVIHFWMDLIRHMRNIDLDVVVLLGNHDRMGLYNDDKNWLPVLASAGATVYSEVGEHGDLTLLPYAGSPERWAAMLKQLRNLEPRKPSQKVSRILVFHQSIMGTKASKHGQVLEGYPLSDLKPERYLYCLGGHIHLCQRIGENTHYVGSPFAMDWGEVNQQKYFAVLEGDQLSFLSTGIPGWYDPTVKGFKPPTSWEGTRVRIPVTVPKGGNYGAAVSEARRKAELKYAGAIVTVVPIFEDTDGDAGTIDSALPEAQQISEYIGKVLPADLADRQDEMHRFIETVVRQTGIGLRSTSGVKFVNGYAKGFLSFSEVNLQFDQGGVVLVTGRNRDWPGKSNGSGKTSALSIIPAAIFGKTFKGQAFDTLVQQGFTGTSVVGVNFKTGDGRSISVERSRNPTKVRIWVNGQEISAGARSSDVSKEAEKLCGFSWDTFAMTVYLDQQEIGEFLWGTPKEKEEALARLQNFERFSLAQDLVKKRIKEAEEVRDELMDSQERIAVLLGTQTTEAVIAEEIFKLRNTIRDLDAKLLAWKGIDTKSVYNKRNAASEERDEAQRLFSRLVSERKTFQGALNEAKNSPTVCSQCGQKLPKKSTIVVDTIQVQLDKLKKPLMDAEDKLTEATKKLEAAQAAYDLVRHESDLLEFQRRQWVDQRKKHQSQMEYWGEKLKTAQKATDELRRDRDQLNAAVEVYEDELSFLRAASLILARDGIPAYLSQLICPKLNKAARYFSELFTEGEIQVRFAISESGVTVNVVNANGGREIGDQSSGERKMAALITSFALREVSTKSNVLILDEPGDGLDPSNAAAFASGVRKLKEKFGTIFVMTHNANIEAELVGEKSIVVEKRNGVSSIKEA